MRRACLLDLVVRLPVVPQAMPLLRAGAVHRVWVCLAPMVKAKHLLELLSRRGVRVQACLAGRAKAAPWHRRELADSPRQPVLGSRQVARPHELAGERSWDFRS